MIEELRTQLSEVQDAIIEFRTLFTSKENTESEKQTTEDKAEDKKDTEPEKQTTEDKPGDKPEPEPESAEPKQKVDFPQPPSKSNDSIDSIRAKFEELMEKNPYKAAEFMSQNGEAIAQSAREII